MVSLSSLFPSLLLFENKKRKMSFLVKSLFLDRVLYTQHTSHHKKTEHLKKVHVSRFKKNIKRKNEKGKMVKGGW